MARENLRPIGFPSFADVLLARDAIFSPQRTSFVGENKLIFRVTVLPFGLKVDYFANLRSLLLVAVFAWTARARSSRHNSYDQAFFFFSSSLCAFKEFTLPLSLLLLFRFNHTVHEQLPIIQRFKLQTSFLRRASSATKTLHPSFLWSPICQPAHTTSVL